MEKVNFHQITDELAGILKAKNEAYGNSFDQSMDEWGLTVGGVRLDDKRNRINGLIRSGEMATNGESLLDNLFDLAGYSCLMIRYLVNHGLVEPDQIAKYFPKD